MSIRDYKRESVFNFRNPPPFSTTWPSPNRGRFDYSDFEWDAPTESPLEDSNSVIEEYFAYMDRADESRIAQVEDIVSVQYSDRMSLDAAADDTYDTYPVEDSTDSSIPRIVVSGSSSARQNGDEFLDSERYNVDRRDDTIASTSPQSIPGAWPKEPIRAPPPPPPLPPMSNIAYAMSQTIPLSVGAGVPQYDHTPSMPSRPRRFSNPRNDGLVSGPRQMPSILGLFGLKKKTSKAVISTNAKQKTEVQSPKRGVQVSTFDIVLELHRLELIRIAEEDALLAKALQAEEDSQHDTNLQRERDREKTIATDRLLAEALMREEQEAIAKEEARRKAEERSRLEEQKRKQKEEALHKATVGAPIGVRRINPDKTIVDVGLDTLPVEVITHLKNLKATFSKSLPAYKVTKVEWIMNDRLRAQFEKCKEDFQRKGRSTEELLLFHGTAQQNIDLYIPNES
jgi:hypothetical protein